MYISNNDKEWADFSIADNGFVNIRGVVVNDNVHVFIIIIISLSTHNW